MHSGGGRQSGRKASVQLRAKPRLKGLRSREPSLHSFAKGRRNFSYVVRLTEMLCA